MRFPRGWLLLLFLSGCTGGDLDQNAPFVPVITYRGLADDGLADERRVARTRFAEQMRYLADNGYATATVSELAEYMRGERFIPPKTVVITFEDARDVIQYAAATLDRFGLEATFYLGVDATSEEETASGSWEPLRRIARSPAFEFGAGAGSVRGGDDLVSWYQGATPGKGPLDVVWEVEVARQVLEKGLGQPVRSYVWPEGRTSPELVQLALKAGYTALMSSRQITNFRGGDPLAIGRYPVLGSFGIDEFRKLLGGEVQTDVAELLRKDTRTAVADPPGVARP